MIPPPAADSLYDRFSPGVEAPDNRPARSLWFVVRGSELLVRAGADAVALPQMEKSSELGVFLARRQYLGALDGIPCFSGEMEECVPAPAGTEWAHLRSLFGRLDDVAFWVAARAVQIVEWDRNHQFCGHCGAATRAHATDRARECVQCGLQFFPRIAPAVIILVERGDELLLVRSHRLPPEVYSVVAGFVEPGETLEQAAAREIREEAGIEVRNLRYFCSQPWPFPHSLMIAFTAEYASGEIRIDPREIADGGWYRHDRMPRIPGPLSVARRMIDWHLDKHGKPAKIES